MSQMWHSFWEEVDRPQLGPGQSTSCQMVSTDLSSKGGLSQLVRLFVQTTSSAASTSWLCDVDWRVILGSDEVKTWVSQSPAQCGWLGRTGVSPNMQCLYFMPCSRHFTTYIPRIRMMMMMICSMSNGFRDVFDVVLTVCNFVVHDRCLNTVVSPCSSIATNLIKVCWTCSLARQIFLFFVALFFSDIRSVTVVLHLPCLYVCVCVMRLYNSVFICMSVWYGANKLHTVYWLGHWTWQLSRSQLWLSPPELPSVPLSTLRCCPKGWQMLLRVER